MRINYSILAMASSWKKTSLLAVVSASIIIAGCKKNDSQDSESALTNLNKDKNVAQTNYLGSGWTDITSNQESGQTVHLENYNTSGGPQTEPWNGGSLSWYVNSSEVMTNSTTDATASYQYNSSNKTHTFSLIKYPGNRSEIRLPANYTTAQQFEGTVTINDNVWSENAVFQIWGGPGTPATLMQIKGDSDVNGGQLRVVDNGQGATWGSDIIATNILNKPVRINVIHKQDDWVWVYVNGVYKFGFEDNVTATNTSPAGSNYFKYGNYGRDAGQMNSGSVVTWRDVKIYSGSLSGAKQPTTTKVTVYGDCSYGTGKFAVGLVAGTYTMAQLTAMGVTNDQISSINVPSGYSIQVYTSDNYGGSTATYTTNQSCLNSTFNDQISSVRVNQP
jgi:hypothetical protein